MIYRRLADIILLLHMAFILFAVFGALIASKWRSVAWLHIPAALWAALIEFKEWNCPLTPLENWFRRRGGEAGYQTGFIDHYISPLIYPGPIPRGINFALGLVVVVVNLAIYSWIWRHSASRRRR